MEEPNWKAIAASLASHLEAALEMWGVESWGPPGPEEQAAERALKNVKRALGLDPEKPMNEGPK